MIHWLEHHLFPCFFKSYLGIDCPGCGSQRAFIALIKGNVIQSLQFHAALIPFLLTCILLIIQLIVKHKNGGKYVMWLFIFTSVITTIQYIVKQIMLYS